MRQVVIDTETTGLYPKYGHRIIELACIELRNKERTGRKWQFYFNPKHPVDPGAVAIHGLTNDFLENFPQFYECAEDILNVFGDDPLIIHNAPFDVGFLNAEFKRLPCYPLISMERVVDTLQIARKRFPGGKNSLDGLCNRFKIDRSSRTYHGAMIDVELLTKVYFMLDPPVQTCLNLDSHVDTIVIVLQRPIPLPSRLTPEELTAHAEMLAKLGAEPLWNRYAT